MKPHEFDEDDDIEEDEKVTWRVSQDDIVDVEEDRVREYSYDDDEIEIVEPDDIDTIEQDGIEASQVLDTQPIITNKHALVELSSSVPDKKAKTRTDGGARGMPTSGMAGIAAGWVLKVQSDVKLSQSPTVARRRTHELWQVAKRNPGYLEGSRSYAGFTFVKLKKQETVWTLLLESTPGSSLTQLMLKNHTLTNSTTVKIFKPVWRIKLQPHELAQLQQAGYDCDTGVMVCVNWHLE